jgi:hypothetical protein
MTFILFWLAFCGIVGIAANSLGRSLLGWFFLSAIISPLLGGLLLFAVSLRK